MKTAKISNPSIVLQLSGLTKKIGGKAIVDGLSFDIAKGEVVGLLGPNGAGKTTTMRMIVGLIGMTDGDVHICGQSIRTNFEQAIRHVGGIIENPEFYPYMTGYDNLKQYQRMTEGVTDARIEEVTKLVGMQDALDKRVKAYSLGMRQRLGIAQALLHEPKLLILDEPTNGLDPAGIKEMREYLKRIAEAEGIAILVSSHLLSEIELMCSRVIVIQEGKYVTARSLGETESPKQKIISISLQVGDAAHAQAVIEGMEGIEVVSVTASRMTIQIQHEKIPGLVAGLATQGVEIYRIEEVRETLEDEFMKLTGGNRIA
ncbi:ABC transporter ATP-binding protein [Paenibacillus glycanilyticus]|uniref:ABC transporter ATP-binding protein n=1 Tax=Paenibacillus glycanilyticus TaxID=126569 RepID=A0ABQ6GFV6_9BACL|nr:ABC transporter ATP-binding protein [Paenibacillus glycanilyticus]GLX68223.1 ABC transporter ATP-binding protein [Paenibacillus glycanilyticus]